MLIVVIFLFIICLPPRKLPKKKGEKLIIKYNLYKRLFVLLIPLYMPVSWLGNEDYYINIWNKIFAYTFIVLFFGLLLSCIIEVFTRKIVIEGDTMLYKAWFTKKIFKVKEVQKIKTAPLGSGCKFFFKEGNGQVIDLMDGRDWLEEHFKDIILSRMNKNEISKHTGA